MACSNCFNGCADIVSDQCVKYTGIDIPELGISTGDPLLVVETQLANKILELITGEGIIPVNNIGELCNIISDNLPSSGDINLRQVINALFTAICTIDSRLSATEEILSYLESIYDIDCLTGVDQFSGTHDILQATVTKICELNTDLASLAAELVANYVLIGDINDYIAAYLASQPISVLYNAKMIPYVAVPYFGPTVGIFDITGAGIGDWLKIYLCNGQNLTPDLRGRVLVGNTTMGNTAFNPAVDPAIVGNPTYSQGTLVGANTATLTSPNQLPPHIHSAIVNIVDPGHFHPNSKINPADGSGTELNYDSVGDEQHYGVMNTLIATTGISATATIGSTGASEGHNNIQPVVSTNFIIYLP